MTTDDELQRRYMVDAEFHNLVHTMISAVRCSSNLDVTDLQLAVYIVTVKAAEEGWLRGGK